MFPVYTVKGLGLLINRAAPANQNVTDTIPRKKPKECMVVMFGPGAKA